eukprot:329107-Chlamydomonas_euryale.AAC.5
MHAGCNCTGRCNCRHTQLHFLARKWPLKTLHVLLPKTMHHRVQRRYGKDMRAQRPHMRAGRPWRSISPVSLSLSAGTCRSRRSQQGFGAVDERTVNAKDRSSCVRFRVGPQHSPVKRKPMAINSEVPATCVQGAQKTPMNCCMT